jgi:hypothetical protein
MPVGMGAEVASGWVESAFRASPRYRYAREMSVKRARAMMRWALDNIARFSTIPKQRRREKREGLERGYQRKRFTDEEKGSNVFWHPCNLSGCPFWIGLCLLLESGRAWAELEIDNVRENVLLLFYRILTLLSIIPKKTRKNWNSDPYRCYLLLLISNPMNAICCSSTFPPKKNKTIHTLELTLVDL